MIYSRSKGNQLVQTWVNQDKTLHPRIFCRRWFGLEELREDGRPRYTEGLILAIESEHGYREKCVNLLANILKIKPNTIQRWGKGVEFNNIPKDKRQQYETFLGYVDTLRNFIANLDIYDESLALKIIGIKCQGDRRITTVNNRNTPMYSNGECG